MRIESSNIQLDLGQILIEDARDRAASVLEVRAPTKLHGRASSGSYW
jgi:hypothetical protein